MTELAHFAVPIATIAGCSAAHPHTCPVGSTPMPYSTSTRGGVLRLRDTILGIIARRAPGLDANANAPTPTRN